jgi:hypothetical protein
MKKLTMKDDDMPAEIDFREGLRHLHQIPSDARIFVPISVELGVWEYFSGKAEQKGVQLPDLLSEVPRRDIEINEALK